MSLDFHSGDGQARGGEPCYVVAIVATWILAAQPPRLPLLQVAPTSHKGDITQTGVGSHAALLKTIEDMLGVPLMNQGQLPGATDLRSLLGL